MGSGPGYRPHLSADDNLDLTPFIANMSGMPLARRSRAFVAIVTAVLVLLCQTAYAARSCAPAAPAPDAAATAPCHGDAGTAPEPSPRAAHGVCEAAKATAEAAKIHIYAPGELPAMAVAYSGAAAATDPVRASQPLHAVCYSPPLTLLHCRLLN